MHRCAEINRYIAALDLFDELISHILWIGVSKQKNLCFGTEVWFSLFMKQGIILFCVALLRSQVLTLSKHGSVIKYQRISFLGGVVYTLFGLVYGVLFACHNIEGGTVLMGLPFCVLIVLYLAGLKRELIVVSPIAFLFFVSHVFTLALLLAYYNMFGGFPEFSQLKGSTIGSFYATTNHKQEL